MHTDKILKISSTLILSMTLISCGSSVKGEFSDQQICKAVVAKVNGRNPSIIKVNKVSGDVTHLSYIRENDGTKWTLRCKLEGSTAIWATESGRWRKGQYDSKITFSVNKQSLSISEKYSDGSGDDKIYNLKQLGS